MFSLFALINPKKMDNIKWEIIQMSSPRPVIMVGQ
jgi:hypothetical protein